jgi:hypothetical protein
MMYAASVGRSASSGTTTGIQRTNAVSSRVSERLLAGDTIVLDGLRIGAARRALPGLSLAVEETVMLALLPPEETSNAMKGSLIDAGRSTALRKDGAARCPSGFDTARPRYVCHA